MRVRNVAVVGHNACGKTTLVEAMLFKGGAKDRLGKVEDGNTASDHSEAEKRRGISISTSVLNLAWQDTHLNLLDAPGYADFVGEIRGALRAADSALVVVNATAGVAVGTERVWNTCDALSPSVNSTANTPVFLGRSPASKTRSRHTLWRRVFQLALKAVFVA
jgi:elongation factor G